MPVLPDLIRDTVDIIEHSLPNPAPRRGRYDTWNPIPDYIDSLARTHPLAAPMRIAIDPGRGVAARTAPLALRACGADVVGINLDPDPNPTRPADPQHADNMRDLCRFVRQTAADIGFAFDGDGDRLGLVDRRGRRATPDQVLALLAQDWLQHHPGRDIHIDVKTSQTVVEHIQQHGGRAVFGPVGHSLGKHAMAQAGIAFGGEASTHYFQALDDPPHITDDAVRTACWLAATAADPNTPSLEERLDRIPQRRTSPEIKLPCPDDHKFDAAQTIADHLARHHPVIDIDGARVDLSAIADGAWALIRASNTTPFLTIVIEAHDDPAFANIRDLLINLLNQTPIDPAPLTRAAPLN